MVSNYRNIFEYIESLPRDSVMKLYGDETRGSYACKAVLQSLPELGRQIIIRIAVCGGKFPRKEVDKWHSAQGSRDSAEAIQRMEALFVVEGQTGRKRTDEIDEDEEKESKKTLQTAESILQLTPEYFIGITKCLNSLQSYPWSSVTPSQQASMYAQANANKNNPKEKKSKNKYYPPAPSEIDLDTYTQKRWNSVLHFLVGSDAGDEDPPAAVEHFLKMTGLMQDDPDWKKSSPPPAVITSKGYEFMLQDLSTQLWQFILQYLNALHSHTDCVLIRTEALLFLICLSFCRVGRAYLISSLSTYSKTLAKDFSQFGLVYIYKLDSSSRSTFYPTRVAVHLLSTSTSNNSASSSSTLLAPSSVSTRALEHELTMPEPSSSHIAIIVQTNFQLCAYTTSSLHVAMLGLFCEVSSFRRLPNIIFYKITRDSVKSAFRLGITATQIVQFLIMHAHPKLRNGDLPLLPFNVRDQILLWDRERSRVVFDEIYTLQCQCHQEFQVILRYSLDHYAHAWSSEVKHTIMLKYPKAEQVMTFLRRWRSRPENMNI